MIRMIIDFCFITLSSSLMYSNSAFGIATMLFAYCSSLWEALRLTALCPVSKRSSCEVIYGSDKRVNLGYELIH